MAYDTSLALGLILDAEPPVQERVDRLFRATARLELTGVAASQRDPNVAVTRLLMAGIESVLRAAPSQSEVEMAYSTGLVGERGGSARLQFRCNASSETRDRALLEADRLADDLAGVLRFADDVYSFERVREDEHPTEFQTRWSATVMPRGYRIPVAASSAAGFLAPKSNERDRSLLVAPLPGSEGGDSTSLMRAILRSEPATLRVSIRRFTLTDDDRALLRGARAWLTGGGPFRRTYHPAAPEGPVDEPTLARLLVAVEAWFGSSEGFAVSCRIDSAAPIRHPLLEVAGHALFATDAVAAETGSPGGVQAGGDLDLRGCFVQGLPLLLPPPLALREAGVRRYYAAPRTGTSEPGVRLGSCWDHGRERGVFLDERARIRHCLLVGSSGSGKSTLLRTMIAHDLRAGHGVCVVDPHGDLYEQILEDVPTSRRRDVVLIDPTDESRAVGLNFLELPGGRTRAAAVNFVVNEMIGIFDQLYNLRLTGGPIFEQYMRNALLLLLESSEAGATLCDVPRVFEDSEFRSDLVDRCSNRLTADFWTKQAERAHGDAALTNLAPYVTSKLNQFTSNGMLRPIVGQGRSTVSFSRAMDRRQILLVNLSKGLLGQLDSRLLGMLVLGKFFVAALGRAAKPVDSRPAFHVYVDEAQNFVTDTFAHMLAESRKYGLGITMANQTLTQLAGSQERASVLDAVLGNVGTLILFRLGVLDAGRFEPYVAQGLRTQDLLELPDRQAAARLQTDTGPSAPLVFEIERIPMPTTTDGARALRTLRRRYTRKIEDVERELMRRRGR
jgi:hypothetical protein